MQTSSLVEAMHSVQSPKPSDCKMHQEEGFQAVPRKEKENNIVRTRNDVLKLQSNRRKHTLITPSGLYGTHPYYDNEQLHL